MRQKLKRFELNKSRENIIELGKPLFDQIKGQWNQRYFVRKQPITLELACGNGEYTVGLARQNPDYNFIGIDMKGDRLFNGSTFAIDEELNNVGFLRIKMLELENFFETSEVSEIWLTFPDPRPRDRDIKRRLTHPRFLGIYKEILDTDGYFKFKTDNTPIFDYTLEVFEKEFPVKNLEFTYDLYNSELLSEHYGLKTKYEKIWTEKGEKIKYLKCQFI